MVAFFGQRRARQLARVGNARKAAGVTVLILLALLLTTCAMYLQARRRVDPLVSHPAPGWQLRGPVEAYAAADMYLKIDGAADTYLRFNARRLRFASYARDVADGAVVEVYCYDMASPHDARAAYEAEKPPDAVGVSAGDAAYRAGGTVFFVHGNSYVRVIPMRSSAADAPAILELAQALAR